MFLHLWRRYRQTVINNHILVLLEIYIDLLLKLDSTFKNNMTNLCLKSELRLFLMFEVFGMNVLILKF